MKKISIAVLLTLFAVNAFASLPSSVNADDHSEILQEIKTLNRRVTTLEDRVKEPDIHICYCDYQPYAYTYYAMLRGRYLDAGNAKRSDCEKLIARAQECKK